MARDYSRYAQLIITLQSTPKWTLQELCTELGWGKRCVRISAIVNSLHEAGIIRIVEWRCNASGYRRIPVYAFGGGVDAIRTPAVLTSAPVERRSPAREREFAKGRDLSNIWHSTELHNA